VEQRKLLLADDSITIQKVINLTFADEGIEVTAVGNGATAIERLPEIAPDLVLADVHMPGLNGYEVCERIRNTPEFQDVPVMLLVGSFEPFDETEARRVGANDFLTKPFQSIKQLVNKVHGLLEQTAMEGRSATTTNRTSDAEANEFQQSDKATPIISAQEIGFATENDDSIDLDIPAAGGRTFDFGKSEFDDELIETTPVGGNSRVHETAPEADGEVFETTLENYQETDFQSAFEATSAQTESESEWRVVESDEQIESDVQSDENFVNPAPTMELYPEMIPTETAENPANATENFEVEFEIAQPINAQNSSQENLLLEDLSQQNSSQEDFSTFSTDENDFLTVSDHSSEPEETFQVEFEATADEPFDLTEEISGDVSEEVFAPSTLAEETFAFDEPDQTSADAQTFEPRPEAVEAREETVAQQQTERQEATRQPEEPIQHFAETPAQIVRPFITPLLDDDEFLLDIQLDEPQTGVADSDAAAQQQQSAFAETVKIEPVTPEIVAPADEHPTQELAPINQQTSMEKPSESFKMGALQFPPEVIDAIAQRVVEKLSDKVIEKIAWEIVPDRFDLIVRKTIKSQDSER
jgi:CheY-like chemotaxis protein